MLKKPSILLSQYGNVYSICYSQQIATSPACPQMHKPRPTSRRHGRKPQWRNYAQVCSGKPFPDKNGDLPWPDLPSATSIPSPYQIFHIEKSAPYSKRHFYELVKLYHPDRHGNEQNPSKVNGLSYVVKMERYRLVVAANDILSDPEKRKAYDRYGAGWNGRPDSGLAMHNWSHNTGTRWSGFDHNSSPAHCATWEDWEKWYEKENGGKGKQEVVYVSNAGFLSLVIIVIALSGFSQATRVGDHSRTFLEQIEAVHGECSDNIKSRRRESHSFGNKDERLQNFLRTRDETGIPLGYGASDASEVKTLPPSDT